jgi:hypothetical protein
MKTKLDRQCAPIYRLDQARPELSVHGDACADDVGRQLRSGFENPSWSMVRMGPIRALAIFIIRDGETLLSTSSDRDITGSRPFTP